MSLLHAHDAIVWLMLDQLCRAEINPVPGLQL